MVVNTMIALGCGMMLLLMARNQVVALRPVIATRDRRTCRPSR